MYFDGWEDDLSNQTNNGNDDSFLPFGLLMAFEMIENILDEVTRYMNQEFMNEEEIKPLRNRERRRRAECEKLYQWKGESQRTTTLINKTEIALSAKAIKSNVGISTKSNNIPSVSYTVLSDRTPKAKEPPSSSERVTSYDANFDRDNPSLLSNVLVPSLDTNNNH
jgi:hypothetical protein